MGANFSARRFSYASSERARRLAALFDPTAKAVAEWAAVAILSATGAYLVRIGRGITDTQRATKVLMRSDLIGRWREARDAGWMADDAKRQWVDDHALYLRLVGKNNYLDEVQELLLMLPSSSPQR
jgi:hypothetical protein